MSGIHPLPKITGEKGFASVKTDGLCRDQSALNIVEW